MKQNSILRTFAKYVSLNVAGVIGLSCYILADTFFVARGIGANGLAALNLAIPVYSFIHGIGLMIGMGGATRFSLTRPETVFTQSLHFALAAAVFFVSLGLLFPGQIALWMGADHDTLQYAGAYLRVILLFAPMFLLNNVVLCFVRNDGNPQLSMAAMLAGSVSNILLDYVFIFPGRMGMFGAALATGIAPVISLLLLSAHFLKKRNTFHITRQKPQIKALADIASTGLPALITEFSSGIVIIVFNQIILSLEGNTGVAAYGIIANIALVVLSIFTGVSQGMQPIISRCHGVGNRREVRSVLAYGFITVTVIAVLTYVLSFLFAEPIVLAFDREKNSQLIKIATLGLRIYFTAFVFAGINLLAAAYFSAVDCPKRAFTLSILRGFIVILPAVFLLSRFFGISGVWIAQTCSEAAVLLVSVCFLSLGRRRLEPDGVSRECQPEYHN